MDVWKIPSYCVSEANEDTNVRGERFRNSAGGRSDSPATDSYRHAALRDWCFFGRQYPATPPASAQESAVATTAPKDTA